MIAQIEKWLVVALTLFLMTFALLQIALRDIFSTGLVWADTLLRHVVIWIGLIGAMRATAEDQHIRIDLAQRFLSPKKGFVFRLISDLVPLLICAVLCYASLIFLKDERMAGNVAFPGVPYWWLQIIFPVSFGVMTFRYGSSLIKALIHGPENDKS